MKKLLILSSYLFMSGAFAQTFNLHSTINKMLEESKGAITSYRQCYDVIGKYYSLLFNTSLEKANLKKLSKEELTTIFNKSFETRLKVRERLNSFNSTAPDAELCLSAVRNVTRVLRYLEDYIVEEIDDTTKTDYQTLKGSGLFFATAPSYTFNDFNDLKSGDVILSRGGAYTSAAIARIGQDDAQFSHISIVYKDKAGKLYTVEAHIEIGSVVAPIQKHIDQENIRTVVFRYKDKELAHKAAEHIYNRVKAYSASHKENIYYDFGMDYKNHDWLFCSEVVYEGFMKASNNTVSVPLYRTKFPEQILPFLNTIGIKLNKKTIKTFDTFAPGDLEFDTRFDLVAEWRRPNNIHDMMIKDAILTKVYDWMKQNSYTFYPTSGMGFKSRFGWTARRVPLLKKLVEKKLPKNMTVSQMKTFQAIDAVGEGLTKVILDQEKILKRRLSFSQMFDLLEKTRVQDKENYAKRKEMLKKSRRYARHHKAKSRRLKKEAPTTIFHQYFR